MSQPENINTILKKSLKLNGEDFYEDVLRHTIFDNWKEIAGVFADRAFPLKIKGDTLVLCSDDSSTKDKMKFLAGEIVDKINEIIGEDENPIKRIDFGRSFDVPIKKNNSSKDTATKSSENLNEDVEEITLTPEEIAECEKKVAAIEDAALRQEIFQTFVLRARVMKLKYKNGWHKCKICNLLCRSEEIICPSCRISEREKMRAAIQKIFYSAPYENFKDIQSKITKKFPYLKSECTFEFIDAVRMNLILKLAALVPFGDTTSYDAKFLVMLIRQLPEEKLTTAIIRRTLNEFKFNLADKPSLDSREFAKSKATLKKSSTTLNRETS